MKRLLIILWLVVTTSLYAHSQVYYIREGGTSYGRILLRLDKKFIREGQTTFGKIKYYIDRR